MAAAISWVEQDEVLPPMQSADDSVVEALEGTSSPTSEPCLGYLGREG